MEAGDTASSHPRHRQAGADAALRRTHVPEPRLDLALVMVRLALFVTGDKNNCFVPVVTAVLIYNARTRAVD